MGLSFSQTGTAVLQGRDILRCVPPPPVVHDSSTTRYFVLTSADVLFHDRRGAPCGPVGPLESLPEFRVQIRKVGRAFVGAGRGLTVVGCARSPASRVRAAVPAPALALAAERVLVQ